VLSGVLLGIAFLPLPLGMLAWVALVPLLVALERAIARGGREGRPVRLRRLFAIGYAFGFAFYLIGMHWIALLSNVAITIPWLKYPAWIFAAGYLAIFGGLAALLAGWLARSGRVPLAFTFPAAFLVIEELRGSGELGFPWFQPGYTQHAYAPLIQMACLGSVTLVTLWLLVLNVLVWRAFTGTARRRAAIGALLLVLLPWCWGQRVLDAAPHTAGDAPRVAIVQGDIASEIKWSGDHQPEILARFLALSARAAAGRPRPALAIWPETATGSYLRKQLDQAFQVAAFASKSGVPVFAGYADYDYDSTGKTRIFNAAGLFSTDGAMGESYGKRHLVPFGERMPFQRWFPALGRIELGQAEWTPGPRSVLFRPPGTPPFACLICFESIFPDLARSDVRAGAGWLVNITNDEWFGNSAALRQHAAMAVFRAVENHVPLARCANTGLSLVIDANGRIVGRVPVFRPELLLAALPARGWATPYTRFGDWPGLLATFGVLVMALLALRGRVDTARTR
jgi:apolipoprotein N-acyltransferase